MPEKSSPAFTTSTGAAARRGAAAPVLPAVHDRCRYTHLAAEHNIGVRKGVKVRTACANGTCGCRSYEGVPA